MNNAINGMCAPFTSYTPRLKTDTLFELPAGSFKFRGAIDKAIKHVQDGYLTNAATWQMFVEQFRGNPDDANRGWKGEYWGKMMRGSVFTYRYTGDKKLYATLVGAVEDMLSAQDDLGRFSTYSTEFEFDGWDLWARKYILLGFEYFLDICQSNDLRHRIIAAMCRHADYIMDKVGKEEDGKKLITKCTRNWLGLNSSSILEPYVRLYNITGDKRYFDYATYIVDCGGISEGNIWDLAYEDKIAPFEYKTNKAYEMMSCFEGLLEYYRVTGIEKYKQAVIRVAKRILETDITIIGCSGCTHELFDNSAKNQLNTDYGGIVQETCVTVTWMKFCFQLLSITADPTFADAIEISTYNAMLGCVNDYDINNVLAGFPFDSYSPLLYSVRARSTGGYQVMKQGVYGCCACIGSAGTALMANTAAMLSKNGLYVNLYIPGTITTETPKGKKLNIDIETAYPREGAIRLTVDGADGEKMLIALRVPSFSKKSSIKVNGKTVAGVKPGYVKLNRVWNDGDVIDIELDVRTRTYYHEGNGENAKYHVALYHGPVVLARDARLGEQIDSIVDIAADKDGYVAVRESNTAKFPSMMEYKVPMKDGSEITVIDYASAGKTWSRESLMTAWMATKDYFTVDYTKPMLIRSRNGHIGRYLVNDNGILHGDQNAENATVFTFEDAGDGYYRIKTKDGKYLTAKGENPDDSTTFEDYIDCGCQKWKFVKFVQNRFFMINARTGCTLYESFTRGGEYRMYATEEGSDEKYAFTHLQNNIKVNVLMELYNVKGKKKSTKVDETEENRGDAQ